MSKPRWIPEEIVQRLEKPASNRLSIMQMIQKQTAIVDIIATLGLHPQAARTRAILCDMLGYRPDARSIPILVLTLHDRSAEVRSAAADSLGNWRSTG